MIDKSRMVKQRPYSVFTKLEFDSFSQNTLSTDKDCNSLAPPRQNNVKEVIHNSFSEADRMKFKIPKGMSAIKMSSEKNRESSAPKQIRNNITLQRDGSNLNKKLLSHASSFMSEEEQMKKEQIQTFYHKQLKQYEDQGNRLKRQIVGLLDQTGDFYKQEILMDKKKAEIQMQITQAEKELKQSKLKNTRLSYQIDFQKKNIFTLKNTLEKKDFEECKELETFLAKKQEQIYSNQKRIDQLIAKLNVLKIEEMGKIQIERANKQLELQYEKIKGEFHQKIESDAKFDSEIDHLWGEKQILLKEIRDIVIGLK